MCVPILCAFFEVRTDLFASSLQHLSGQILRSRRRSCRICHTTRPRTLTVVGKGGGRGGAREKKAREREVFFRVLSLRLHRFRRVSLADDGLQSCARKQGEVFEVSTLSLGCPAPSSSPHSCPHPTRSSNAYTTSDRFERPKDSSSSHSQAPPCFTRRPSRSHRLYLTVRLSSPRVPGELADLSIPKYSVPALLCRPCHRPYFSASPS